MSLNRREFIHLAAAGVAVGALTAAYPSKTSTIQAIAFDAFPIFDPRSVFALAEQLFPGNGAELSNAWRTRQFEYQWLRALTGNYEDFEQITEDSLIVAAQLLKLDLSEDKRHQLTNAYLHLNAWPDVPAALKTLRASGTRLGFLSNATPKILNNGIQNSGLAEFFEFVLSTDQIKTFKPDHRAYQLAIDALRIPKEQILFVAFAGWDAAGAKSFGYPTFWVNRLNAPAERLGVSADGAGASLNELVDFVKKMNV